MKVGIVFFVFSCLVFGSCSSNSTLPTEGVVEYKIEYLDSPEQQPIIGFLPNVMTVSYNKHNTHTQIEGFMGLFSLSFIAQTERKKHYTLLRVMDKKYYYEAQNDDLAFGYKGMGKVNVRYLNETREIAGCMCNKAIGTNALMNFAPLVLYYTYELDINSPNKNTPFQEMDGVLMAFQVKIEEINMRFEAFDIKEQKLNDSTFEVPADYTKVNYTEMKKMIDLFKESS